MNRTVRTVLVKASRQRLTAPLQAVAISTVAFLLGSGFGCAPSAVEESDYAAVYPGEEAGAVAEARAVILQDRISICERERADLERLRDALVKDAASQRERAAAVWTEPGLSERERAPTARRYIEAADDDDAKAHRYQQRIESYAAQIALLENKRRDQLFLARKYENMSEPLPY
jgi:hypothetical protein